MRSPRTAAPIVIALFLLLSGCVLAGTPSFDPGSVVRPDWEGLTPIWLPTETAVSLLSRRIVTDTPLAPKSWSAESSILETPGLPPTYVPTPSPLLSTPEWVSDSNPALEICSPLANVAIEDLPRVVSDRYNPPPMGSDRRHQGVDFAYYQWKGDHPIADTPVRAVMGGSVAAAEANTFPFGNVVIVETPEAALPLDVRQVFEIDPGESLYTLYGHLNASSPVVVSGQAVDPCELLGYVGKSGNAGASHLHLENRVGPAGSSFNGFSYYRESDSLEARQNYRLWAVSGVFLHFDPMRLLLFETTHGATPTPTAERVP